MSPRHIKHARSKDRAIKKGSAADGVKTGDGHGVGFFIPLPSSLASAFPSLGSEDKSPAHSTFLYVGKIEKDQEAEFLAATRGVFDDLRGPVRGSLDELEHFVHPAKERQVGVMTVRFSHDLADFRWRLRDRLITAGFQVDDSFPLIYRPHVTLEYMEGLDSKYDGKIPQGWWEFNSIEIWGLPELHTIPFGKAKGRVASRFMAGGDHKRSLALMKWLSGVSRRLGVGQHVYVVGGAVRDWVLKRPIKDIDVVIDSVGLGNGRDSAWFAKELEKAIPVSTSVVTNQYGVAILTVKGDWKVGNNNLKGEVIEIANARSESYGQGGYKPEDVSPATIQEDVSRREFTFNSLLWRMHDLAAGPDKAEILDLTGCGLSDLEKGVLACPSDPDKTFSDDPSRMVRAVKFILRYGFKVLPEVAAAIQRNKAKLKNIPNSQLSNLLISLLNTPNGKKVYSELGRLGLLDVIREIAEEKKPFREALANWADKNADVQFVFHLMDLELPSGSQLRFLDRRGQQKVREITVDMDSATGSAFVAVLRQPSKLLDMRALIAETGLQGKEISKITSTARDVLLADPALAGNKSRFMARVRAEVVTSKRANEQVYKLWKLLDDVDTAGDICKGDQGCYRETVEELQAQRWDVLAEPEATAMFERYHGKVAADVKDLKRWKADLRRMTKIYRSIPSNSGSGYSDPTPAEKAMSLEIFAEARGLFSQFARNWKTWIYDELLPPPGAEGETWHHRMIREKAWTAYIALPSFQEVWDYKTDTHVPAPWKLVKERDTNIRRYQRAFTAAFAAIAEYLESEGGGVETLPPTEKHRIGPATVVIHNQGRKEDENLLRGFLTRFEGMLKSIVSAGFPSAVKGLVVHIHFKMEGWVAGQYVPAKDRLEIHSLGLGRGTLTHEIGHRFWYKALGNNARAHWNDVLKTRTVEVTEGAIHTFVNRYVRNQKWMLSRREVEVLLSRQERDEELKAQYRLLADHSPAYTSDPDEILTHHLKNNKGDKATLEHISDYGATSPVEAFAEAFRLYVEKGPRALGPWTRQFFERVNRSGGAKFASAVRIRIDPEATAKARQRWPMFDQIVVATFDSPIGLYRVFDENELGHILRSGKLTGGKYSVKPERSMGASWGSNITHIVNMGNRLRGKRLGEKIYLAKIDGFDMKFLHLDVKVPVDVTRDVVTIPRETCNPALGCSVADVTVADVEDFYEVDPRGQIHKLSVSELRGHVKSAAVLTPTGKKSLRGNLYLGDLGQDEFVHFTPTERALEILASGKLLMNPPYKKFGIDAVAAVSTKWGWNVPGVQTTHIKGDQVGIVFQTSTEPKYGAVEEVIWEQDVTLKRARVVPFNVAISMLRRTPERLPSSRDQVVYSAAKASRYAAVARIAKTFTLDIGDPILTGKYLNSKGRIIGFGTNEKGEPTVNVETEPDAKGKTKKIEVKLFKIRYDKTREKKKADTLQKPTFEEKAALAAKYGAPFRKTAKSKFKKKKQVPKADGKGKTTVYEYSESQIQHRNREKAKRVEKLRGNIDKLQAKFRQDLKSDDEKTRLTALVVGLMDETYERIGNDQSAKEGHFGVTGWQVKHISFDSGGATVSYVGKSGVKQTKKVSDKALVAGLKAATKGKKPEDTLCTGDDCTVGSAEVNAYLKPHGVTAKDIRGLHANSEMQSRLKAIRSRGGTLPTDKGEREKKLKEEFTEALDESAKAVGHEPSTLRSQYLVPGMEDSYMRDGSVKEKLDKKGFDAGEAEQKRDIFLAGFFSKYPKLRKYRGIKTLNTSKGGGRSGHGQASQVGDRIELHPGFWQLSDDQSRAGVYAHEIGHWVLSQFGISKMVPAAEGLGIDVWDRLNLPFGQFNMDEAFADSFASYFIDREVFKRYPAWAKLVEVVAGKTSKAATINIDATDDVWDPSMEAMEAYLRKNAVTKGFDRPRVLQLKMRPLLDMPRKATKSDAEKEEDEATRLVRKEPKKKPPRNDLRRQRIREGDPDLDGEKDPDMSLNYKKVARRFMLRLLRGKGPAPHKPSDVWETEGGNWAGMNGEGITQTYMGEGAKDKAQAWAKGEDAKGEKEEDPEAAKEKKEERAKERKKVLEKALTKKFESAVEDMSAGLSDEDAGVLKATLETLSDKDKKAAAEAYSNALGELVGGAGDDGFSKSTLDRAAKSLGKIPSGSAQDMGQGMAEAIFAKAIVANPKMVGGTSVNGEEKTDEQLASRATEAFNQYQKASPEIRQEAMNQINAAMEGADASTAEYKELTRILHGLSLAASVAGQPVVAQIEVEIEIPPKKEGGKPKKKTVKREKQLGTAPSKAMGVLAQKLGPKADLLMKPVSNLYAPEGRAMVEEAMESMDDAELGDFLGGEDGDWGPMVKALKMEGADAQAKAFNRELLQKMAVDSMTTAHSYLMSAAQQEMTPEEAEESLGLPPIEFDDDAEGGMKLQPQEPGGVPTDEIDPEEDEGPPGSSPDNPKKPRQRKPEEVAPPQKPGLVAKAIARVQKIHESISMKLEDQRSDYQKCLDKAITQKDLEKCKKVGNNWRLDRLAAYRDASVEEFGEPDPKHPNVVQLQEAIRLKDTGELDIEYVRSVPKAV